MGADHFDIKEGQLACSCGRTHFLVRLSDYDTLTTICTTCGQPTEVQTYDWQSVWVDGPARFEAP